MNNCSVGSGEHTDLLLDYCARRLDAETASRLERHMEACAGCALFRDSQRAVWGALDSWEAPPVSAGFNQRLYARIEAAGAARWYSRWLDALRPVFSQPALPLGAATLVIVAGFVLDHPARVVPVSRDRSASSTITKVSATEAEQVESTLDDLEMLRQFDVSSEGKTEDKERASKSM